MSRREESGEHLPDPDQMRSALKRAASVHGHCHEEQGTLKQLKQETAGEDHLSRPGFAHSNAERRRAALWSQDGSEESMQVTNQQPIRRRRSEPSAARAPPQIKHEAKADTDSLSRYVPDHQPGGVPMHSPMDDEACRIARGMIMEEFVMRLLPGGGSGGSAAPASIEEVAMKREVELEAAAESLQEALAAEKALPESEVKLKTVHGAADHIPQQPAHVGYQHHGALQCGQVDQQPARVALQTVDKEASIIFDGESAIVSMPFCSEPDRSDCVVHLVNRANPVLFSYLTAFPRPTTARVTIQAALLTKIPLFQTLRGCAVTGSTVDGTAQGCAAGRLAITPPATVESFLYTLAMLEGCLDAKGVFQGEHRLVTMIEIAMMASFLGCISVLDTVKELLITCLLYFLSGNAEDTPITHRGAWVLQSLPEQLLDDIMAKSLEIMSEPSLRIIPNTLRLPDEIIRSYLRCCGTALDTSEMPLPLCHHQRLCYALCGNRTIKRILLTSRLSGNVVADVASTETLLLSLRSALPTMPSLTFLGIDNLTLNIPVAYSLGSLLSSLSLEGLFISVTATCQETLYPSLPSEQWDSSIGSILAVSLGTMQGLKHVSIPQWDSLGPGHPPLVDVVPQATTSS